MSELMSGGINLMVMGMATVFIFLALLVVGTNLMSFVIKQLPAAPEPARGAVRPQAENSEVLTEVAAVAAAARQFHKR